MSKKMLYPKKMMLFCIVFIILATSLMQVSFVSATTGCLKVQIYNVDRNLTTNSIKPSFKLFNTGTASINLANVKIRYYYTKDGTESQFFTCDYSNVGSSNITGTFNNISNSSLVDCYLEVGFTSSAGSLLPGSFVEIQTRINKSGWINYSQSNDYSFNQSGTDFMDWNKACVYLSGSLEWGINPTRKFLIIVSKPLYDTGNVAASIDIYKSDLISEGWLPNVITINNTNLLNPDYMCQDAASLKQLIMDFREQYYEGFVLVGSAPSIPIADWELNSTDTERNASDLYFADSSTWSDADSDGIPESWIGAEDDPNRVYVGQNYAPEMFWGRIDAGRISSSLSEEAAKVSSYLYKIHLYRINGSPLSTAEENRSIAFNDDDFSGGSFFFTGLTAPYTSEVRDIFDAKITRLSELIKQLEAGSMFFTANIHGSSSSTGIYGWENGIRTHEVFDTTKLSQISPRVHFMNLESCYATNYKENNLGASFLFNNPYTYNLTGLTGSYGLNLEDQFYETMSSDCIGLAFKNHMQRIGQDDSKMPVQTLLGDPTLRYPMQKRTNNTTPLLENVSDFNWLEANVGSTLTVPLSIVDPDSTNLTVTLTGLPSGASYNSTTRTITWTPTSNQRGKTYTVNLVISDGSNVYTTDFTMYVSYFKNSLINSTTNWNVVRGTFGTSAENTYPYSPKKGPVVPLITNNSKTTISQTITVERYKNYTFSYWTKLGKVNDIISGLPEQAKVKIPQLNQTIVSDAYLGGYNYTECQINSGDNTSLTFEFYAGDDQNVTGKVFYTGIGLYPIVNLGFENVTNSQPDNWSTSAYTSGVTSFSAEQNSSYVRTGSYSAKISSPTVENDAHYDYTTISIKPYTSYKVSAYIKTQNVQLGKGANLTVNFGTNWVDSSGILGTTSGWQKVEIIFESAHNSTLNIQCRLGHWGGWGGLSKGTAWFDDIKVEELN